MWGANRILIFEFSRKRINCNVSLLHFHACFIQGYFHFAICHIIITTTTHRNNNKYNRSRAEEGQHFKFAFLCNPHAIFIANNIPKYQNINSVLYKSYAYRCNSQFFMPQHETIEDLNLTFCYFV